MSAVWIGECNLRAGDRGDGHAIRAAALCEGPAGWTALVRAGVEAQGWRIETVVEVVQEETWRRRHPADPEAGALAGLLSPGHRVAFGALREIGAADGAGGCALRMATIGWQGPLRAPLGTWPKPCLPEALRPVLFGPCDPAAAACYALVDAAKVPLLPELLEASGLPHRCLFGGGAGGEMRKVAPYLVSLEADSDFTRSLFTDDGHANGLWRSNAAVFLRSALPPDALCDHLERIARVRGPGSEAPGYLRFWAPETLRALRPALARSEALTAAFFSDAIAALVWRRPAGGGYRMIAPARPRRADSDLRLDAPTARRFALTGRAHRVLRLQDAAETQITARDPAAAAAMVEVAPARRRYNVRRIDAMGITSARTAAALLSVIYLTGLDILAEPSFHYATRNRFLPPEAKARQLLMPFTMIAEAQRATAGGG